MLRLICITALFLTSCSTIAPTDSIKDGPPTAPSPIYHDKKVHYQNEPLSRYGNPMSYTIKGQRYVVLRKTDGFKQQGVASWYGTKFHKKRTSSGEPYDMYAMTAAHKTLPLPTYLRVINLENNKQVIVKVNDRGPFHEERILDLSYAAAKKLDILKRGTGTVEIVALTQEKKLTNKPLHYYLQVGAFAQLSRAQKLESRLETLVNYPVNLESRNDTFLVNIGPINELSLSKKIKSELNQLGFATFSMIK
jgi:peptidoglycan lytic transglycosylase